MATSYKPQLTKQQKRRRHLRRFLRVFAVVSLFIILVHIFAPMIALKVINDKMAKLPEYHGHIDALQINMFTGQATVKGMNMTKKGGEIPVPFFDANRIWVGIDWKSLFKGRIVAEVEVDDFQLNFVKGPTKESSQTKVDKSWLEFADKMMPISVNKVKVNNGEVHYRDFHSTPKIDVYMHKIFVVAENLSTVEDTTKALPASAKVTADVFGGTIAVNAKVNVFKKDIPDFDVNAEVKNLNLTYLNSILKAYAKMDVKKGLFSVYMEAAAKEGLLKAYAKPFIKDLDVIDSRERKDMPFKDQVIESLVEVVAWIFENKKTDQVATKIELEGKLLKPGVNVWGLIGETLVNAFIEALMPTLENSINLNSVGTEDDKNFLEKIFDPKDKKKNKEKGNVKKDTKKSKPKKKNKKTAQLNSK